MCKRGKKLRALGLGNPSPRTTPSYKAYNDFIICFRQTQLFPFAAQDRSAVSHATAQTSSVVFSIPTSNAVLVLSN